MKSTTELTDMLKELKLETFIASISKINDDSKYEIIKSSLHTFCQTEINSRLENGKSTRIKMSGFPKIKTFAEFDFTFNHQFPKNKILELQDGLFVSESKNIIFVGSSGVGKTHLATAIGVSASNNRVSTYFIKCQTLIANLKQAYEENRLEVRLRHYCKYKLLIIDEMGFLPIGQLESKLLFQLIDKRYECKSTIITTNVTFDKWANLFYDPVIANAILDRLLHHSVVFKLMGESYRLKDIQIESTDET